MKISMIPAVDLARRNREKELVRKRSKITGVALDYLEVVGEGSALFADAFPHEIVKKRKKRKKP